jgi:hypothetical protein
VSSLIIRAVWLSTRMERGLRASVLRFVLYWFSDNFSYKPANLLFYIFNEKAKFLPHFKFKCCLSFGKSFVFAGRAISGLH